MSASKGFHIWNNARAVKAGLRFRPIEATLKDTLEWYKGQPKEKDGRVRLGFTAEQETKLLKAWKDSKLPAAG